MDIEPRIPSINDPFNLSGCAQLPFPLTPSEDIILKHILGICASDYQMSKRAYDSIICMWAKKNQFQKEPFVTSLVPNTIPNGVQTLVTINGENFHTNTRVRLNGIDQGDYATFINSNQITMVLRSYTAVSVTLQVVNDYDSPLFDVYSNNMTLSIS